MDNPHIGDLAQRFPGLFPELKRVEGWFDTPLDYAFCMEPMDEHADNAERLERLISEDVTSRQRVAAITSRIQQGGDAWPLFLFSQDRFLLEGWHRLVAFRRIGLREVPVVLVTQSVPEPSSIGFTQAEIHGWGIRFFSARWLGHQIGHLRVNHTTIPFPGERHVDTAFVLPAFRRRGVAQALYDAAEAALRSEGLRLVPSPRPSMTDEAVQLWKKRSGER